MNTKAKAGGADDDHAATDADLMDLLTDDLVFSLAAFLDPNDLLALGLSCKRFGARPAETTTAAINDAKKAKICHERELSLVEEAARRRAEPAQNDDTWSSSCNQLLPRKDNESWLAVDNRLHQLSSVAFHRIIGEGVKYINSSANHVKLQSTTPVFVEAVGWYATMS